MKPIDDGLISIFSHEDCRKNLSSVLRAFFASVSLIIGLSALAYGDNVTYSVPVPSELETSATFKLTSAQVVKTKTPTGTQIQLVYRLPPELVGSNPVQIELSGEQVDGNPEGAFEAKGPFATASCLPQPTSMSCKIKMTNDVVNPKAASVFLEQNYQDLTKRQQLNEVMMRFSGDPIGVIFYQD